jgi:hypothetical protein
MAMKSLPAAEFEEELKALSIMRNLPIALHSRKHFLYALPGQSFLAPEAPGPVFFTPLP